MAKTYRSDEVGKGNKEKVLTDLKFEEKKTVDDALEALERYKADRVGKEKEWTDSYSVYQSWIDKARTPFTANLFIPKVHNAVEQISAFLLGPNQSVTVRPEEGMFNWIKAKVAEKWLDFIWRKRLNARLRLQTWVKQGIIFGNGVLKVGYDYDKGVPMLGNTAIEDVYFDFYESDIQESEYLIHVIRRSEEEVRADDKYDAKDDEGNFIREYAVITEDEPKPDPSILFSTYDRTPLPQDTNKVVLYEVWRKTENDVLTVAATSMGWRILRQKKNRNKWKSNGSKKGLAYRPFVKLRFKVSPLANRAYDTGAVWPTVKIQKAFNDLFNQVFTNIALTNNAMWMRRKGASINARDLIRRPGGVITVKDVNSDLKPVETPAIKPEVMDMLNRLDNEFREASMVSALAQGIADTATEATMGQENFYTLLRPIQDNISDSLSELGAMVLQMSLDNAEGSQTLEMFENDNEVGILTFDPELINADYDTRIVPDRNAYLSKLYRQKQLMEFINVLRGDPNIFIKYPDASEGLYRMWLEEAGFSNADRIFGPQMQQGAQMQQGMSPSPMRQAPDQLSNPESIMRSINSPSLVAGELSNI